MEGKCSMAVPPLVVSTNLKFPTKKSCQKICDVEPKCKYYFHGSQKQSCEIFPNPQKVCTGILGRVNCSKGKFELRVIIFFSYYKHIMCVSHCK